MGDTTINDAIANEIAELLRNNGYSTCTAQDVVDVALTGSVAPSIIGDEYDENLTDQIVDQLDKRGIEVG